MFKLVTSLATATLWVAGVQCAPGQKLLGSSFGTARNATYDYVVVGGGTAGLTIASRLAEHGTYSVAVIEAGSFYEISNSNLSQVPFYAPASAGAIDADINPLVDWNFFTTRQRGLNGKVVHFPAGKTLGGGSARNFFVYQRGTKQTHQQWAEMVGDSSYAWDNFLPYFQKSVGFTPPKNTRPANATARYDRAALGTGNGPLSVTYPPFVWPFTSWAERGFQELGIQPIDGFNSGFLNGSSYFTYTQDATDAIRESSETSFLRKIGLRSDRLVVYQSALAKRVLFDSSKAARGVEISIGSKPFTISANKEVIVSAGAFQSPHLLMVSGVGPLASLRRHGIPIVADRPGVGQNMWDHVLGGPSYRVNIATGSRLADPAVNSVATQEFIQQRNGPLTAVVTDFLAWEKIPESLRSTLSPQSRLLLNRTFPRDWPEFEDIPVSVYWGNLNGTIPPPSAGDIASVLVALVAPLSRGTVDITSADMADPPVIDPAWLTHPTDQEVAVAAFKRARQLFETRAVRSVLVGDELFPGWEVRTDEQILQQVRDSFGTVYHPACTCKMGRSDDPMAVVDTHARVFGVQRLRVVDASALPLLPPGHPQATIYALAEKIADDILGST